MRRSRTRVSSDAFIESLNIPFSGQLIIDRRKGDEWGKLVIGDDIRKAIYQALMLNDLYQLPDYEAHISVFDREEVVKLPKLLPEENQPYRFYLVNLAYCNPENWDEVDKLYMVHVYSPELESLRRKYGFTSKMSNNQHEFHITICTRLSKIARRLM